MYAAVARAAPGSSPYRHRYRRPTAYRFTRATRRGAATLPAAAARAGRLRYFAEPVATILASHPHLAEDLAELAAVAVEPLPPLLDAAAAAGSFAPGTFDRGKAK